MAKKIKLIVTNRRAMQTKYGDDWPLIQGALRELVQYDELRGLDTRIAFLDDQGIPAVPAKPKLAFERWNKEAIDKAFREIKPWYLVILGADDIVPFQRLKNPKYSARNPRRNSPTILSDLPYACEKPHSMEPDNFLTPTRIISRIPDVKGDADKGLQVLLATLDSIIAIEHTTQREYGLPWAACTSKRTTPMRMSLRDMFDEDVSYSVCPPNGPVWQNNEYSRMIHFHILHGGRYRSTLKNESLDDVDPLKNPAVLSQSVSGNIEYGTIVLERACHGGQLYNPVDGKDYKSLPLVNMYLRSGAAAMLGSLTTNYSNRDGQKLGDHLMVGFYLCLNNCSIGEAFLTARQNVCRDGRLTDLADKVMFLSYVLYGDASLVPMADGTFDEIAYNSLTSDDEATTKTPDFPYIGREIPEPVPQNVEDYIEAYLKEKHQTTSDGHPTCNAVVEGGEETKFRYTVCANSVYPGGETDEEPEETWFVFEGSATPESTEAPVSYIGQYVI